MMTPEEQDSQLLDDYLAGNLSPAEEEAVRARAQADAAFADLLELYRIEHATVEQALRDEFRAKVKKWENNPPGPPNLGGGFKWLYLIGLIPIALAVWWALSQPALPSSPAPLPSPAPATAPPTPMAPEDTLEAEESPGYAEAPAPEPEPPSPIDEGPRLLAMANKNYTTPRALTITVRSTRLDSSAFANGARLFKAEDYAAALDQFAQISSTESASTYLRALPWRAHALFKLNRFTEAAQVFAELAEKAGGPARDRAEWYRALSLLAAGNKVAAETLLSQLEAAGEAHIFSGEAKELLLELKK